MDHDSKSQLGLKSKRDTTISHSSTEDEIKTIDLAIREATWFRGFLSELGTNNIKDMTEHLVL
jgi:hypothetical protein